MNQIYPVSAPIEDKWNLQLKNPIFKAVLLAKLTFLAIMLYTLTRFLTYVETRDGFAFYDPILNLFQPQDLSWIIFSILYGSLLIAIITLIRYPFQILSAIGSYSIMLAIRMLAMTLLPLSPPQSMLLLKDPFVEAFWSSGLILTKDLYFSGHTATMFIIFLTSRNKYMKAFFLLSTIAIGISVITQHVHYAIDVFSAPFFAYAAYVIDTKINRKIFNPEFSLQKIQLNKRLGKSKISKEIID